MHIKFWFCDEGSGAPVQMCRFARALKSRFYAQMVIGVHNCTGSPEHSSLDKVITAPKSRAGNVCAIYASTEGTAESAYLRRLA